MDEIIGKPTIVQLLKKAQRIGNEYSENYCKQQLSRQFLQKRLDFIKLIDEEMAETSEKLKLLRAELADIRSRKKVERFDRKAKSAEAEYSEKSIQVNFPRNAAVQVNFAELCHKNDTPKKLFQNRNLISLKSRGDQNRVHDDSAISSGSSFNGQIERSHRSRIISEAEEYYQADKSETKAHKIDSRFAGEERYLSKLNKMLRQNRETNNEIINQPKPMFTSPITTTIEPMPSPSPPKCTEKFDDQRFANFIVDKICDKLNDLRPLATDLQSLVAPEVSDEPPQQHVKEYRNVAIETTFNDIHRNVCEEEEIQSIAESENDTIYMGLPDRHTAKPKTMKAKTMIDANKAVSFNLDDISFRSTRTSYREIEPKLNFNQIRIDLIDSKNDPNNNDRLKENEPLLIFDDDEDNSCNTSMFRTLPAIESSSGSCGASTPKASSTLRSKENGNFSRSNIDKDIISLDDRTLQTLDDINLTDSFTIRSSIGTPNAKICSKLDQAKFWNDLFANHDIELTNDMRKVLFPRNEIASM